MLPLIAKGLALPQISGSLCMEPTMVDVYRRNIIMRKLHRDNDAALAEYSSLRKSSTHPLLFGRLQPSRNVAACMQYPPDVDVIIALYVEDQIGIRLQLPTT